MNLWQVLVLGVVGGCSGPSLRPVLTTPPPAATMATAPPAEPAAPAAPAPTPASPAPPVFVSPPREAYGDVPRSDATGSFVAAPRADWPCAVRERYEGEPEWKVKLRFVYGTRTSCRLPVALVDDGIVGCVERAVTPYRGKYYDLDRLSFADDGTLAMLESNLGRTSFTWDAETPHSKDEIASRRAPGRIEASLIGRRTLDVDADGRPLRLWYVEKGKLENRCEYAWTGMRFGAKQCYDGGGKPTWRTEAVYDCSSLPRVSASVNREGAPGIPGR
jgi:hypothetical protein